ncbi:MAG: hypothetical protein M1819_000341 [Sarea resinae]|nr:MAG: hypothetical protein M1819_000341 [Sarea resinae]
MRTIKEAYPRHTYSALALADAFNSAYALSKSPEDDGLPLTELNGDSSLSCQERLERYISALPSATSKHDLVGILRTRLIVAFGKKHGCESVAWGDSTTRLAEKMLAETAKGRGFALPWHVSDGMTPYGLTFTYPLRDLLKKEIIMYSSMTNPLSSIVTEDPRAMQPAASAKDTTIDQLMSQYFESVEENYPAIVANVVRTSSKLEAPRLPEQLITCTLCSMPIADGITGIHGWGGDQEALPPNAQPALVHGVSERLCYGCARSVKG